MSPYKAIKLQLLFFALSMFLLMLQLLPISGGTSALSAPDTILALALCWAVRAPFAMGTGVVMVVMLTCDIVLQKPLGLASLSILIAIQWLRYHSENIRDMAFVLEWLTIGAAYLLIYGAQLVILKLIAPEHADVRVFVVQAIGGVLFYPIAVSASFLLFGIRRTWTTEETRERISS